jgi:hypothetical protein
VNFDAGRTKIAVRVLREFAREGHQLLVFTCHEHVWRLFGEVKADTRRIPNRYNKNEEGVEPEFEPDFSPEPEPVAELPAPQPEPEPIVVEATEQKPEPVLVEEVEQVVEVLSTEYDLESALLAPQIDEVEYSWQDWPRNGKNGKAGTNGRHTVATPTPSLRPWPAEPMIHRPDWW